MESNTYTIDYHFLLEGGKKKSFSIEIDEKTMLNTIPPPDEKPFWVELDYNKCECCPLEKQQMPYCPIALNIMGLVEAFKDSLSSDNCKIECVTPERVYYKESTAQDGLFSIFGVINATSRCPIMRFFRPMARFHLPFSTVEETKVRVASFFLLSQYFQQKKRNTIDIRFEELDKHYENVQMVDKGILNRIRGISKNDADQNAFVVLNSLAQIISFEIDEKLQSIEEIFETAEK